MALELNTDGDAQTFTAGDAGFKYGNTNTSTVGAVYGFCTFMLGVYAGFVNVVTGVFIDMHLGVNISLFYGYKFQYQGGRCTTMSAIQETNVKADVMKKITNLQTLLTNQTQFVENCTLEIGVLNQHVDEIISNYEEEKKNGDISTETWTTSKSITSGKYELNCNEKVEIKVGKAWAKVDSTGVGISGPLVEIE
jgi:hypothetical protein